MRLPSLAILVAALVASTWPPSSAHAAVDASVPPHPAFAATIPDLDGAPHTLDSLAGRSATVIAYTSGTCPLSRKLAPELERIAAEFEPRGVHVVRVAARGEDLEALRATLEGARCLVDGNDELARALRPSSTTEVFVFNADRELIYRGAINDQYGVSYARPYARSHYLRAVLEATLRGDRPLLSSTIAPGCALAILPDGSAATTTYEKDVAPLVARHCLECHRTGGPAPFALERYDEVAGKAAMIRQVVAEGLMPPWSEAPLADGHASRFANARIVPPDERAAIVRWVDEGAARGDPASAKPFTRPAAVEGWQIGEPDLVLQIPAPQTIPAEGVLPYRMVNIPTGLTEDRYVEAIEVQPTSTLGVHHVLVFALPGPEETKEIRRRNLERRREAARGGNVESAPRERAEAAAASGPELGIDGSRGYFAAYVPGNAAVRYPKGTARRLSAGGSFTFALHYVPYGEETTDQTRIGIVFAKDKPSRLIESAGISDRSLLIPPHAREFSMRSTERFDVPVRLVAFLPHMHLRGTRFRYEAEYPDGRVERLLDVPRYDFRWQHRYLLREHVALPAGSRLHVTGWFDNSVANPANPDPTVAVPWGPQTHEEMNVGYVEYYVDSSVPGGNDEKGAAP
ncbi:MAG: redoxin family protein [Phycisphaerae bacterium]|nr:redoxin family protein [Phycisphaerae bacterium]